MMSKYHLMTFGCQMNKADSETIAAILEGLGYEPVSEPATADLIVANTCCVRKSAEDKAYGRINSLTIRKVANPNMIIGIGGCLAQQEQDKIFERVKPVDFAFGPNSISLIPSLIARVRQGEAGVGAFDPSPEDHGPRPIPVRQSSISAWVPISVGCSNFCSYCIVPHVRGPERSLFPHVIVNQIRQLSAQGYSEVTLLGQNVNTYGHDLEQASTLAELLSLINETEGLARIRFTTSHPRDFGLDLVEAVAGLDKVCEYLHLPIQSGSDRVLKSMNRGYSRQEYLDLIALIRTRIPGVAISSDFIVGYPGETDKDFSATFDIVERAEFDQAFVFLYSPRAGTPAAGMPDQVSKAVKQRRFEALQGLINDICQQQNLTQVGTELQVLNEGRSKKNKQLYTGRSRTNKIVHFSAPEGLRIGTLVNIKIESGKSTYLIGRATGDCA